MPRFTDKMSDLKEKRPHLASRSLSGSFIVRLEPYLFVIKSPKNISPI